MRSSSLTAAISAAVCVLLLGVALTDNAWADNTSSVFGSTVKAGEYSWEYRAAYDNESHGFAHRIHAQKALNDSLRARLLTQFEKTDDRTSDFDYLQAELLWQFGDDSAMWQRAMRFDLRWRHEGRPGFFRSSFTNQWAFAPAWRARALVMARVDIGSGRGSGVDLETRASIQRKLNSDFRVGLEVFSEFGRTGNLASGSEQVHQFGPTISAKIGNDWSVFGSTLFGLTDSSPDAQLRVFISRPI